MGSGTEGSGGAGAVQRRRGKPSGEATGGVQDLATAEQPVPVQPLEQVDRWRILRWSEVMGG
jgi:hypothetical protein